MYLRQILACILYLQVNYVANCRFVVTFHCLLSVIIVGIFRSVNVNLCWVCGMLIINYITVVSKFLIVAGLHTEWIWRILTAEPKRHKCILIIGFLK